MTAPMTTARLEEIERELSGSRIVLGYAGDRDTARELLAEVTRLRAEAEGLRARIEAGTS
jgi:hypothetical protein